MTIEWRYTTRPDRGVLSLTGHLGLEAVARCAGAIARVLDRGPDPVILDLTATGPPGHRRHPPTIPVQVDRPPSPFTGPWSVGSAGGAGTCGPASPPRRHEA